MSSHILVIGLNTMGRTLARELVRRGSKVTVVDRDRDRTRRIMDEVDHALTFDSTDRRALETLDIAAFDRVVVCMGHAFEAAERTTLALLDFGARSVVNTATTSQRRDILLEIGAHQVLTPGLLQARNLAVELVETTIDSFFFVDHDLGLAEVRLESPLGLDEAALSGVFGPKVRYVGFRRKPAASTDEPAPARNAIELGAPNSLVPGDSVLLFGDPAAVARAARKHLGRT
ncbi:MAG: NAD-binding protein [Planctomycetes bacterium]|nr:NAD-binding protein [Planctomycetota bacterium]